MSQAMASQNADDVASASRHDNRMSEIDEARKAALDAVVFDPAAQHARVEVCDTVSSALQTLGHSLWVGGWLFGEEWTRGLGIVVQMGGELAAGAVTLLRVGQHYPVAALVRQLIEVEYLAFTFAHDEPLAKSWLACSPEQLRKVFTPAQMRHRSGGRFRDGEYWTHCETGGHPHPRGAFMLPCHQGDDDPGPWQWGDLAQHLARLWDCIVDAVRGHQWHPLVDDLDASTVRPILKRWYSADPFAHGITLPAAPSS